MARKKVPHEPGERVESLPVATPRPRRQRRGPVSVDHVMQERGRVDDRDALFDGMSDGDDPADDVRITRSLRGLRLHGE